MREDLERTCDMHPERFGCGDVLMHRASDGAYGIIVQDGGSSVARILVCPWCGSDLHDGSVEAYVDLSTDEAEEEIVEFDIAPLLAAADDDALAQAATGAWSRQHARKLIDGAGTDSPLANALQALRAMEIAGRADGDECWMDPIAADLWLRRNRPHLIELTR
jgi:hypothetical protein